MNIECDTANFKSRYLSAATPAAFALNAAELNHGNRTDSPFIVAPVFRYGGIKFSLAFEKESGELVSAALSPSCREQFTERMRAWLGVFLRLCFSIGLDHRELRQLDHCSALHPRLPLSTSSPSFFCISSTASVAQC